MIDFRSDTVTRPSAEMKDAMMNAEVGDDVYGDDPTVNELQARVAALTGKEDALFAASGTQSNVIGILAHCGRGDEYIVGQDAHTYLYEGGAATVIGAVQPQPLDFKADGTLDLDLVEAKIKPDDPHFVRTKLVCLENTHNGISVPLSHFAHVQKLAQTYALSTHLDGARLFNAVVAEDVVATDITRHFDSVSICFSKGLGAPVGSAICGSKSFIARAKRARKMCGGGMRQVGLLAAACNYALDNNIQKLADDHANAHQLAQNLRQLPYLKDSLITHNTNMVHVHISSKLALALKSFLAEHNILISAGSPLRMVTHLDINSEDIALTSELLDKFNTNIQKGQVALC